MINISDFGKNKDGKEIHLFTLTNSMGTVLGLTDIGASVVSILVENKIGKMTDIVLGHKSGECYERYNGDLMGTIVGRNANRISGHAFQINGVRYELADNCHGMNIHSGPDLYSIRQWDYEILDGEEGDGVRFSLFSPDCDQGMPGNLNLSVTYILTEDNSVIIKYNAVSDKDTLFNVTNHSYFNLNGHDSGTVDEHYLWINAKTAAYSLTDDIADIKIEDILGTALDFSVKKTIGECIRSSYVPVKKCGGLDHNYCIVGGGEDVIHAACLESIKSGLKLDVYTDKPGIQVYTANWINNGYTPKNNAHYKPGCAVALETQFYPDAINHPEFPSPVLKADEMYESCTVYRISRIDEE